MQGSRGLLMGFGKAKLVAPPVRKFAPSIKPQAAKPAVVELSISELDIVQSSSTNYECLHYPSIRVLTLPQYTSAYTTPVYEYLHYPSI